MGHEFSKKSNSPRVQSAIKKVIGYLHLHHGGWHFTDYMCRPDNFGLMVFLIAYKADKYDVLNRLSTGFHSLARSFIRADIRRKKPPKPKAIGILAIILLIIITF